MMIGLLLFMVGQGEFISFPEQPDIKLEKISGKGHKVVFFAPHENEHVIEDYLKKTVPDIKANFYILRQNGERHLTLKLPDGDIVVDPNRIFTPEGTEAAIRKMNPTTNQNVALLAQSMQRVDRLRDFLLNTMGLSKKKPVVIAIHNNTDGYDDDGKGGEGTISIVRYQKRFEAGAKYIKRVNVGSGDEDDLIFLTHSSDFRYFRNLGYNLVQQNKDVAVIPGEDDGSLSVWAAKKKIRYLNLEAQRKEGDDHTLVQRQMVDAVIRRFLE